MKLEVRNGAGAQTSVGAGWSIYYDRQHGTASFCPPGPQTVFSQVRVGQSDSFTSDLPVRPDELEEFIRRHTGCRLGPPRTDNSFPATIIHNLVAVETRVADMPPTQPRFIDPADPLPEYNRDYGASD